MNPDYALTALVWSLVGFLCGFTFAKVQPVCGGVSRMKMTWSRWVSVLLILMGVLTAAQGYYFNRREQQIVNCQEKVNEELRAVGREERRDYFITWRQILNSTDRTKTKQIFEDHLNRGDEREAKRDQAEKTRKRC